MDPFNHMEDWKKSMDGFFGDTFWNEFEDIFKPPIPQINLYQQQNELFCIVNLPGVKDLEKIDVFVNYTSLKLRGVIDVPSPGGQVIKEEIIQGVFERQVDLPYPVRSDKIDATYRHGLLVIQLHRTIPDNTEQNKLTIRSLDED
ncbi:Hsp20/alpha crystallin family protein [Radiobacillus kanasensis]|uniref:Hsp20/alpha crystallin family protein n=1 Tax=Radiobacillus kanasensis TaxID=2844358 RepID=UPI001E515948|nr:Hsp20/alpha crystallin family protein [Radiobacillus kanasensis]UFT99902.1 Hsp20/alpha crystallin family protein [Radiobacillus kanasensis]